MKVWKPKEALVNRREDNRDPMGTLHVLIHGVEAYLVARYIWEVRLFYNNSYGYNAHTLVFVVIHHVLSIVGITIIATTRWINACTIIPALGHFLLSGFTDMASPHPIQSILYFSSYLVSLLCMAIYRKSVVRQMGWRMASVFTVVFVLHIANLAHGGEAGRLLREVFDF